MRIKYDCQAYNSRGEEFTLLAKGTEIRVLRVDKKTVKIEWDREGDSKYKTGFGYISLKQFDMCVEEGKEVKKNGSCSDCLKLGNCEIAKAEYKPLRCEYFEEREEK